LVTISGNSYILTMYIPVIETGLVFSLISSNIDYKSYSISSVPMLVPDSISTGVTTAD